MRTSSRHVAGHEVVEHQSANRYRLYDRLVLREPRGRTGWTVLSCEKEGRCWNITAIRCPSDCRIHRRKR
jgi:hypothetical protein